MRVFDCNQDTTSEALLKYDVDVTHRWTLPGVKCHVCGATWATTGIEYPSVNITSEPFAEEYRRPWPVSLEELNGLRERVRCFFPDGAILDPGTEFGSLVGKASGWFPDFVWPAPWTLIMQRDSFERLGSKGVRMPVGVVPELRFPLNDRADLLELEIEPLCMLAEASFRPNGQPCRACGREGRQIELPIVEKQSLPDGVDIFRPRNFPTYILGTERLKQAVQELELTGMEFQEVNTN